MFRAISSAALLVLRSFGRALPDLTRDAIGIVAVGAIGYGAWVIYQPAGFIVVGVIVLAGVLASSIGRSRSGG